MFYTIETTVPTKITSIETYKDRIREIVKGQMKNVFAPYRFKMIMFWLLLFLTVPMSIVYLLSCLFEIVFDTIFLPIFLVPYLRGVPFVVSMLIYGFGVAVSLFALIPAVYDKDDLVKKNEKTT